MPLLTWSSWLLLAGLVLGQAPAEPAARIRNTRLLVPDVGMVSYGLLVPAGDSSAARPLVVALHAGGERVAYQGSRFVQELILPALGGLNAIVVAPDCPARSWTEPAAEQAVLAVVAEVRRTQSVDATRILVTGFSMGGRGAWFFASRHPELFTDAIVMAAPGTALEAPTGKVPLYVIHSRDDQVAPFGPVASAAARLEMSGYPIQFVPIDGAGHIIPRFAPALSVAAGWLESRWRR